MSDEHRRVDDRDREWLTRLDRLEKGFVALESQFALIKQSQTHTDESMKDKFRIIEKSQEAHALKLEEVKNLIQQMATEPDKSPAGRTLLGAITEVDERSVRNEERLDVLDTWKEQFQGALLFMKWVGGTGIVGALLAAGLALLRAGRP